MEPKKTLELRAEADRHYKAKEHQQAVSLYRQLAADNPFDSELWQRIGYCQAELGQNGPAIEAFERALSLGCKFPWLIAYEIAKRYAGLDNKAACMAWLEKSLVARLEDRPGLMTEEAFQSYRDDPHFKRLAGVADEPEVDRDTQWRLDLNHLLEETQRLHIGLARPAFADTFLGVVEELHKQIPFLSDEEIVVEMQRLIAQLGDGHSWIIPLPTDRVGLTMLPIDLYLFSDGLFIIAGVGEAEQWVGGQVLRFGRKTAQEMMVDVAAFVSADNLMDIKRHGPVILTQPAFLQVLRGTDNPRSARLTIQNRQGESHEVTFTGEPLRIPHKLRPSSLSSEPAPLYLQQTQTNYWLHKLPDLAALYIQYNQVRDMPAQPLKSFAAELLETIRVTGVKNLIVDVRFNNGGNNFLNWPLVQTLVYFKMAGPDHQLFILTGRHTFSAAQNFVNWVERISDPIFVGEPTGSRPNFAGESTKVILPYSRLRASISSRLHYDSSWGDDRLWIAPHIPVELSSSDYFANRDPVLEAVLAVLG